MQIHKKGSKTINNTILSFKENTATNEYSQSAKKQKESSPLVKPKVSDFDLQEVVGIGNFGKVHKAYNRNREMVVALKVLVKESVAKMKQVDHIISEREVLQYLTQLEESCPFVMKLFSSF